MKRKILLVLISALWLWNCSGSGGGVGSKSSLKSIEISTADLQSFRTAVLNDLNLVRQTPGQYVTDRLGANLPNYQKCNGGDNGLAVELGGTAAKGALALDNRLNTTATKYARFLHENDKFGHYENGNPGDRCKAEGYPVACGENLAYQASTPDYTEKYFNPEKDPDLAGKNFVLQLLVDCGVADLGHRKVILNNIYIKVGVGYNKGFDSGGLLKHMHVQNFGDR